MVENTNLIFLAAAYGVFWVGTFGYVFFMQRKQRALEQDLEALRTMLEEERKAK